MAASTRESFLAGQGGAVYAYTRGLRRVLPRGGDECLRPFGCTPDHYQHGLYPYAQAQGVRRALR